MKIVVALFCMLLGLHLKAQNTLEEVRNLFEKAGEEEDSFLRYELLVNDTEESNIAMAGYQAAAHFFEAKYHWNPYTKYSSFLEGAEKLDALVDAHPLDAELRYIRFCIQMNLPSFLGYDSNLNEDKLFLENTVKSFSKSEDIDLTQRIRNYALTQLTLID